MHARTHSFKLSLASVDAVQSIYVSHIKSRTSVLGRACKATIGGMPKPTSITFDQPTDAWGVMSKIRVVSWSNFQWQVKTQNLLSKD
eukprot:2471935-Amphidinium_carterae.3